MQWSEGQKEILAAEGHLLVTGGPGSGKTSISIIKAALTAENHIRPGQKVLFLSFARATVSRVVEAIEYEQKLSTLTKALIHVDTYHAFFWRLLKTHGYLIGLPRRLAILTPPAEAVALADIRSQFPARKPTSKQKQAKKAAEAAEQTRMAKEDGLVCFNLFAQYVGELLHNSDRIRRLVATMYPFIVLDEFQDTNEPQWHVVKALGEYCTLIALADPEQRIYDWNGADPARLDHFRGMFTPVEIDLSTDNYRSGATEITIFGNDILARKFSKKEYKGVAFDVFESYPNDAMTTLVTTIYDARQRLRGQNIENWSLAVLVPTKKMTRLVSDALRDPPGSLTQISHTAALDMEGAILSAEVIALLMQPLEDEHHLAQFIELLCNYFQGKNGSEPTNTALDEATRIRRAYEQLLSRQAAGKVIRKDSILVNILAVYDKIRALVFTGDPDNDWRTVRRLLEKGPCRRLNEIAEEVKNVRLLNRGTQLRQQLSQDWRDNQYRNALAIVRQAFIQEHFSAKIKPESGVVVMNMHKAKGKQFDEVIIFEGWPKYAGREMVANPHRIVRSNSKDNITDGALQNLRVSVTRAKQHVTILTPKHDPCLLLPGNQN